MDHFENNKSNRLVNLTIIIHIKSYWDLVITNHVYLYNKIRCAIKSISNCTKSHKHYQDPVRLWISKYLGLENDNYVAWMISEWICLPCFYLLYKAIYKRPHYSNQKPLTFYLFTTMLICVSNISTFQSVNNFIPVYKSLVFT